MKRKRLLIATGLILVILATLSIAAFRDTQPDYLSVLRPYVVQRHSALMHNVLTAQIVGGKVIPLPYTIMRYTSIDIKGISFDQAVALVRKGCPDSNGWVLRERRRGAMLTRGGVMIEFSEVHSLDDPQATASIMENVPVPKPEQTALIFLQKLGFRIVR